MSWIPAGAWASYVKRLAALNDKAAEAMKRFITAHGYDDTQTLIDYAFALATKYGEGAAALSAEMYDAIASLEKAAVPAALPAETATYQTVAKTVQGVAKQSQNLDMMANAVGRLVKQAGADTTLQNALRDGAEFAWIPSGDTCAFCIALASRGWQRASKKAIKNGHAEHIHSNCDCTYAIRFNESTQVRGYDPKKYRAMYENAPLDMWNTPDGKPPTGDAGAEKDTPKNRINALRREFYAENKSKINAQKREAYHERTELTDANNAPFKDVTSSWFFDENHTKPTVTSLVAYTTTDGTVYPVDGWHVKQIHDDKEKRIAKVIAEKTQSEVQLVPKVLFPLGVQTPDYYVYGKGYDLKRITGNGKNTLSSAIQKKEKQSHNFVFDLTESSLSDDEINRQVAGIFRSTHTRFVDEIVLVKENRVIKVLKRK